MFSLLAVPSQDNIRVRQKLPPSTIFPFIMLRAKCFLALLLRCFCVIIIHRVQQATQKSCLRRETGQVMGQINTAFHSSKALHSADNVFISTDEQQLNFSCFPPSFKWWFRIKSDHTRVEKKLHGTSKLAVLVRLYI